MFHFRHFSLFPSHEIQLLVVWLLYQGLAGNSAVIGILGYGGMLATSGAMSIGDITSFLMYATYVAYSVGGLSSFYTELMKVRTRGKTCCHI